MQFRQPIASVFMAKGYQSSSTITERQFQIVMSHITSNSKSDNQAVNSLVKQIWNQTENKKNNSKEKQTNQITTQQLIQQIVIAGQILSNRISQCQKSINDLKNKRKQLQEEKNYGKLQILQHKILTLSKDNEQFENDLRLLTQPFLDEYDRYQSFQQQNPRKCSYSRSAGSIRKVSIENQLENQQQNQPTNQFMELQKYLVESNGQMLDPQIIQDDKTTTLWILGLLVLLQATVMIVKFCFLNLIVFLLGFFVLLQPHRQNMAKIAFYACMFTLPMDILWLFLYSQFYLSPQSNTGLTHIIKPYFQYIWFVTIIQAFIKILYLYTLNRYQHHHRILSQQIEKLQNEQQIHQKQQFVATKIKPHDNYIPNLKEFVKLETTTY